MSGAGTVQTPSPSQLFRLQQRIVNIGFYPVKWSATNGATFATTATLTLTSQTIDDEQAYFSYYGKVVDFWMNAIIVTNAGAGQLTLPLPVQPPVPTGTGTSYPVCSITQPLYIQEAALGQVWGSYAISNASTNMTLFTPNLGTFGAGKTYTLSFYGCYLAPQTNPGVFT